MNYVEFLELYLLSREEEEENNSCLLRIHQRFFNVIMTEDILSIFCNQNRQKLKSSK